MTIYWNEPGGLDFLKHPKLTPEERKKRLDAIRKKNRDAYHAKLRADRKNSKTSANQHTNGKLAAKDMPETDNPSESDTSQSTDLLVLWMKRNGIEVTRQNYLD